MTKPRSAAGFACVLVTLFVGLPAQALAKTDVVALHEQSGLPAQVMVWCLGNEAEFLLTAEGLGIDFERGTNDHKGEIRPPGGQSGSLYDWAADSRPEVLDAFDAACRLAYAAFSRSEARADESEAIYESDGFVGTLVGAGIAGAFGLLGGSWRVRQDAANELTRSSNRFRNAVGAFAQVDNTEGSSQDAEAAARELLAVLAKWQGLPGQEGNVSVAMDRLRAILDEEAEEPKTPLKKFGAAGTSREEVARSLNDIACEIQAKAASVSRRIRGLRPLRF